MSALDACDRLLLAAVAPSVFAEDVAALPSSDGFCWGSLGWVAALNRVESPVATLINREPLASRVGELIRADWRARRMRHVFRSEAAVREVRSVGAAMADFGVRLLLYKGIDFQLRFHPDQEPRGFDDLDIIVRASQIERAAAALESAGYHPASRDFDLDYYRRFHLHAVYVALDRPRPVELHWRLDSPFDFGPDRIEKLFEAAERHVAFGASVLRPCAIDALALMAIHLEKHIGLAATLPDRDTRLKAVIEAGGLVWVLDVIRWFRQAGGCDVDETLRRIRELEAERQLVVALRLAWDVDPMALPRWSMPLAQRLPRRTPLLARTVYPDLSAGKGVTRSGLRRRRFLLSMNPRLGFRPVRVVESLLPQYTVAGTKLPGVRGRMVRQVRCWGLIGANIWALLRARVGLRPVVDTLSLTRRSASRR